jgi:hypothetical protein
MYVYMYIVTYFIAVCFKEILVPPPEDGEIIVPKQLCNFFFNVHGTAHH